jgi:hypothetical protein
MWSQSPASSRVSLGRIVVQLNSTVEDAVSYLAVHRLRSRLAHRSLDDLAKLIRGQLRPLFILLKPTQESVFW